MDESPLQEIIYRRKAERHVKAYEDLLSNTLNILTDIENSQKWKQVKEIDGCKISTLKHKSDKNNKYIKSEISFISDKTAEDFVKYVVKLNKKPKKEFEKLNPTIKYFREILKVETKNLDIIQQRDKSEKKLIKDRGCILVRKFIEKDNETNSSLLYGCSIDDDKHCDGFPVDKKVSKMKTSFLWKAKKSDGKIFVTLIFVIDPNISIPSFLLKSIGTYESKLHFKTNLF